MHDFAFDVIITSVKISLTLIIRLYNTQEMNKIKDSLKHHGN